MKYNKVVVIGHFVVCFDNVINGLLAVVMASYFFKSSSSSIQLLASYASLIALYATGPLGAVVFGRIGDKFGRKKALLVSIMGIGLPTCLIGVMPDYAVWGNIAPLLLVLLRLIQGVFKMSEAGGVFIYNYETGNRGVSSSANIEALGCFGGCFAALLCSIITQEGMPNWGWRIPFICGGVFTFIIFVLRVRIRETDDFIQVLKKNTLSKTPLKILFKKYKFRILTGVIIEGMLMSTAYSSMLFGNRLFQQAGYSISQSMIFNVFDLLWMSLSQIICGKIAERVGMLRQLKYGSLILLLLIWPVCLLISGELTYMKIYSFMAIITFLSALGESCVILYILKMFPISCRYSGYTFTDSSGSIIGSATPFMMLLFSEMFHSNMGCAVWLFIVTVPAFVFICIMNRMIEKRGEFQEDWGAVQ
ncbi:MAG: MFS transporter [Holosporales bacterium]|jgi:MHS family proline/betaine transporter-like MFS transporter|nr:MFS transporter [Holosporales bacterium]